MQHPQSVKPREEEEVEIETMGSNGDSTNGTHSITSTPSTRIFSRPKAELVFVTQIVIVVIIIVAAIVNLALDRSPRELWLSLLSVSIGYIIPSPSMKSGHVFSIINQSTPTNISSNKN